MKWTLSGQGDIKRRAMISSLLFCTMSERFYSKGQRWVWGVATGQQPVEKPRSDSWSIAWSLHSLLSPLVLCESSNHAKLHIGYYWTDLIIFFFFPWNSIKSNAGVFCLHFTVHNNNLNKQIFFFTRHTSKTNAKTLKSICYLYIVMHETKGLRVLSFRE